MKSVAIILVMFNYGTFSSPEMQNSYRTTEYESRTISDCYFESMFDTFHIITSTLLDVVFIRAQATS